MYIVDYTIARALMDAKLIENEAGRRARRGHGTATVFRPHPTWPFTTVFRPAAPRSEGGQ